MSILLWITIEMEYKIKCLKFILFFTNGRQKLDPERVNRRLHVHILLSNYQAHILRHLELFASRMLILMNCPYATMLEFYSQEEMGWHKKSVRVLFISGNGIRVHQTSTIDCSYQSLDLSTLEL